MTERALTRRQLADQLGLSEATIDRRRREGMPSHRYGARSRRYYLAECVEWLTHTGRKNRQESGIGISTVVWSAASPTSGETTEGRTDG